MNQKAIEESVNILNQISEAVDNKLGELRIGEQLLRIIEDTTVELGVEPTNTVLYMIRDKMIDGLHLDIGCLLLARACKDLRQPD